MNKFIHIEGKPTAQQVREALAMYAKDIKRPEFSLIVQRELIESFRNDTAHAFKSAVAFYFKNRVIQRPGLVLASDKDQALIVESCENKALKRHLVAVSGYSSQFLQMVIDHKTPLSAVAARDLKQALPKAEKLYKAECKEKEAKLKKNICGFVACYRNGCHCTKCTTAYKKYRKKQAYLLKRKSAVSAVAA